MDVSQAGGQVAVTPEPPAAAHLTFEDRYEETACYLDRRKDSISIRGLEWEDIRQIVLIRVFTQYSKYDPDKGPFGPWCNRVISNALRRLWRDEVGVFLRPCIKGKGCPHNTGGKTCSQTPSGSQCDECPLYRAWLKKGKYQAKFPEPLEFPAAYGETVIREDIIHDEISGLDNFDEGAAKRVIFGLPSNDRKLVEGIIRHGSPLKAAVARGKCKSALYEPLYRLKPILARLYREEKDRTVRHPNQQLMETKIIIEKSIPLPPRVMPGGEPKYPFAQMEVGDSFFAPVRPQILYSSARNYKESNGCKEKAFSVRKVEENGKPGARVWRVA